MAHDESQTEDGWKIGALAHATGVTVRTLHHYDRIGLLPTSRRTDSGHRIYSADDVARLYRVLLLRRLGFSLSEVALALDDADWQMRRAIERHLEDTDRQLAIASRLRAQLRSMAAGLARDDRPSSQSLISAMEDMTMIDQTIRTTTTILIYDDIAAAQEHICRVFGLTAGELERDASGIVRHGEVHAGDQVIWLHPAGDGLTSPRSLGTATGITVVVVEDVDAHHARAVEHGADIIATPVDQDYGVREYGARDPEGQLWYFHSPLR